MTVQEITNIENNDENVDVIIEALKEGRAAKLPEISEYKEQYDPALHDVLDRTKRKDKPILDEDGELLRYEQVNRMPYPLQKRIVGTAVSFAFGNPIHLKCSPENSNQDVVLGAVKRILHDNKITSFNRSMGRELFKSTEVAEVWYSVPLNGSSENYGFSSSQGIKVQLFSPWKGDKLYPYFDERGDMVAFSRSFERKIKRNKSIKYFETYTDQEFVRWKAESGSKWELDNRSIIPIGKIPVVYGRQEQVEWADVQWAIDRLETLLSNFGDTNDYHAAPKIFVQGEVKGFAQKGEKGAILEGENGATAKYLSWDQAPDSVKLEIETLFRLIYSCTQTPDISFDSVKGLQQISAMALEMLFMDAHLKVQDKREILDAYLQRRINIITSFVGVLGGLQADASKIEIVPQIIPYMVGSTKTKIDNLTSANGGRPIISQKTSIELSGMVDDPNEEWEQVQHEQEQESISSLFEPTRS